MNQKEDLQLFLKELIGSAEDDNLVKDIKQNKMSKDTTRKKLKQANPACRDSKGRDQCPHCGSPNVEYSNYEWFCPDCGKQWDQYGQDTK